MSEDRISYTPRLEATPEGEIAALANVYSFVIRRAEERRRGGFEAASDKQPASTRQEIHTKEVSNVEL